MASCYCLALAWGILPSRLAELDLTHSLPTSHISSLAGRHGKSASYSEGFPEDAPVPRLLVYLHPSEPQYLIIISIQRGPETECKQGFSSVSLSASHPITQAQIDLGPELGWQRWNQVSLSLTSLLRVGNMLSSKKSAPAAYSKENRIL